MTEKLLKIEFIFSFFCVEPFWNTFSSLYSYYILWSFLRMRWPWYLHFKYLYCQCSLMHIVLEFDVFCLSMCFVDSSTLILFSIHICMCKSFTKLNLIKFHSYWAPLILDFCIYTLELIFLSVGLKCILKWRNQFNYFQHNCFMDLVIVLTNMVEMDELVFNAYSAYLELENP